MDVGAASAADVEALGIRILDPVSLRDRRQRLAGGKIAGVAAQARAGASGPSRPVTVTAAGRAHR